MDNFIIKCIKLNSEKGIKINVSIKYRPLNECKQNDKETRDKTEDNY